MHYQSQTLSIDWKIRFTTRTSGQVKHIESTGRVFEWKMHLIFVSDVRVGQNYCGFFKILKTSFKNAWQKNRNMGERATYVYVYLPSLLPSFFKPLTDQFKFLRNCPPTPPLS